MKTELTWAKLVSTLITASFIQWAVFKEMEGVRENGIREDMNNTDAMINRRIDSIDQRLNSWQKSTDTAEQATE